MKQAASDQITRILATLGLLCGITAGLLVGVALAARAAVADCEVEPCLPPANLTLPLALAAAGLLLSGFATYRAIMWKDRAMSLAVAGVIFSMISMAAMILIDKLVQLEKGLNINELVGYRRCGFHRL